MTTNSRTSDPGRPAPEPPEAGLDRLVLEIPADLVRAFRRCTWIIIHETGRDQRDIMREMVRDFLVKHGC